MVKTLKGKLSLIYIILIIAMAFLGMVSVRNLFVISNDISGLLQNNYNSIQAVEDMKDALYKQQYGLFLYLSGNEDDGIEIYSMNNYLFLENLHLQKNNITEAGEKEFVNELNNNYTEYSNKFFTLIEIFKREGKDAANKYFYTQTKLSHDIVINSLDDISNLNETTMINSKNTVENKTNIIIKVTIFITIVSILLSYTCSKHVLKKILYPLNNIIDAIKDIKTNSNYNELQITTKDELGELATQFNLMTRRIKSFEESTLGEILKERNNANAILRSIHSPMVVIDSDFKVTMVNDDFIQVFNLNDDKIEGQYLTHLVKDRNFFSIIYDITTKDCQGDLMNFVELSDENNDLHYYNISINEIKEDSLSIGKVVLLKDVTHLKKVEQISKDFFATISHEFKTPLTSIMIGTGLLESSKLGNLSEEQRKILGTIKEDGERLNLLVSNMLLLSKIESSTEIYKKEKNNIEDLIQSSVSNNKEFASYSGIILEYDVNKNVKPIYCDGEKIIWVLNNLITNSIRHCKNGDLISIRSFSKDKNDTMLNITVTDTGVGILKEYTELIFDKYMQLNTTDIKNKSGLGLWICKDIITAHNGQIKCESDLGEGSTFTITIPYN